MPPLTKEEKKARKEAKRLEKLKAVEEARKKLKYDELKRELFFQSQHKEQLDAKWLKIMLEIKEPYYKQEIEVLWHTFERVLDKKDYLIGKLIKLMHIADDQYQRTVASFCEKLDAIIVKFLSDLEELSIENDKKTAALLKRAVDEEDMNKGDQEVAETHLQLMIYHSHSKADSLAWKRRGENMVKEDEDRTKYLEERENLVSLLEDLYNFTWDQYKAVLKAYVVSTAENQKELRKLRRKENLMADIIASQAKKIANSDGMLKRLRSDLGAYESGTKQAGFRERRNRHRKACFRLKKRLINDCAVDAKQLGALVKCSDDALEWLTGALKKGEKILRLASLCRKLETQREKVLPFGTIPSLDGDDSKSNAKRKSTISDDALVINSISATSGLSRLWQRISKAELIRRALLREKFLLEHENAMLTQLLTDEENEDNIKPETQACICDRKLKTVSTHPVSVEGVFEKSKMDMMLK